MSEQTAGRERAASTFPFDRAIVWRPESGFSVEKVGNDLLRSVLQGRNQWHEYPTQQVRVFPDGREEVVRTLHNGLPTRERIAPPWPYEIYSQQPKHGAAPAAASVWGFRTPLVICRTEFFDFIGLNGVEVEEVLHDLGNLEGDYQNRVLEGMKVVRPARLVIVVG